MAWYDGAVFYQILPGAVLSDVAQDENARSNVKELEEFLSYLKVLGCDGIILGPVFSKNPMRYGTGDFCRIREWLGTEEEFRAFVEDAHGMGIRIILDVAFPFCDRSFFAFQDLQEKGEASEYRNWFLEVDFSKKSPKGDRFSYQSFKNIADYPLFNLDNEELRRYLVEQVKYWISAYDIDGLRLAYSEEVDIHFQKSLRYFSSQMKPEFFLLGEQFKGELTRAVNPETLQSLANRELYQGLCQAFNEKNFYELAQRIGKNQELTKQMQVFLESPNTHRIASVLEEEKNLWGIYMAMFTLPGRPTLYYGGEYALAGKKGEEGEILAPKFTLSQYKPDAFTSYIAKLAEIHGKNSELQIGEFKEVYLDHRLYAYLRLDGNSAVLTVLNNDSMDQYITLALPKKANLAFDLMTTEPVELTDEGHIKVFCEAHCGRIIKLK